MPTVFPIEWQPVAKTGRYPHMAKLDAQVWERWLARFAREWDAVAYDVAVGGLLPPEGEGTEDQRKGWQYTTALKLDALLRRAGALTVVEVRPTASTSALGAALCYRDELSFEEPDLLVEATGIVVETLSPQIQRCADRLGVLVWVV